MNEGIGFGIFRKGISSRRGLTHGSVSFPEPVTPTAAMQTRSRPSVLFVLCVVALWLPFLGLFLPSQLMDAGDIPRHRELTTLIWLCCFLLYLPALLLDGLLGGGGFSFFSFVLCAAQSGLLTWLLFRSRARRAARLRTEGEAAKVEP